MAQTSAMVRNGNCNSFFFCGRCYRRIPLVSKNMDAYTVGEKAATVRELGNEHGCYAIAVLEDETLCTVGHLPREMSKECWC